MRYLFCIISFLQSLSVLAQSEHYNFSRLNTYNGLSHNQVTALLKDRDGFLWFGTTYGLNRYDGYFCRIFSKDHNDSTSLRDNNILSLYELPDKMLWVSTMGGPCIYNPDTEKFNTNYDNYLHSIGLPSGAISNIVKGNNHRFWFLYEDKGLFLYSDSDKVVKPFKQKAVPPSEKITCINETKDGKLWLVYQSGFLQQYDIHLDKIIFSSTALQKRHKGDNFYRLFIDNDGDIWLWGYNFGIFLFHPADNTISQFDKHSSPTRLNSELVSQVVQDSNGLIWVGTDHGGVTLIDKKNGLNTSYLLNNPNDPKSISQNSITTMYKDDQGIIWLGTYKQGVNYYNSNIVQFSYYHHQELNTKSLQFDDVNRFAEDKVGNIWIGTNGGGLIYFDRKNNTFKQYLYDPQNRNSLSDNVIVSLWIDDEDILWIGTYLGGLNRFDGDKFTRYRHSDNDSSSLADDKVWEIFEDSDRNLWIGTLGGGLDRFDKQTNQFHHYKSGKGVLPSDYVSAMMQDRKGNLWIGTASGIGVLEKNKTAAVFYQDTNKRNSLSDNSIICLLEDSKGRIWVGTREGLNLFDEQKKEFQAFTIADGLPDNMILNILEDNHQTLWISTPNGLCNVIPRQENNHIVFSVISYDATNNLQNREFNDNAALKTSTGELIFGGPSGFNIINPAAINQPVYHPKIVFTGFQILNKNVEPGESVNNRVLLKRSLSQLQSIDLKYKENVFSIEFTDLGFFHNAYDKYAYMLEGFNEDWLYADGNQRRATYTNLNPGHYVFKVKVLNRAGLWSDVKTLQINIEPPFWRTSIAYIIYLLIITGLFLLIRRITLDRIHMRFEVRQQRLEAERAHALEQVKTKFFTNVSHEFRTPLSLIIAPLDKIIKQTVDEEQVKQLNLVQRNAKRLLNLVNQLLDFRKMDVQEIKLHPSIGDIVRFCKETSDSFTDLAEKKTIRFSFSSNIDSLEVYFDKDKIEKILFNLLSNAFKYTHDNGTVSVKLTYKQPENNEGDGTLAIEVEDSGIGIPADQQARVFERFFQTDVPESMVNQGTGIGLAITKEFVKLHGGIITVKSEPDQGTCFTVLLPARKIYVASGRTLTSPIFSEDEEQIVVETHKKGDGKKTIIIVEDNEDLRFYLKDNLREEYHIEEATNGKEGWEKVKLLNPDLVVSDIMMPLMDGVELAKRIKRETLTAHIPVILLTAMGSEEKQLEGLKAGVNDYITKPFTFEILASRINNLLAQQRLLQKRFQKQIEVNPGEVTITPVDEKFLKQALEIIEKQIDNAEFSVDEFSKEMYMSRATLYRKIHSLTGKSPLDFIRSIRLKRAVQLFAKSGLSISEVAYQVGFNDPKIFRKFFKEEFKTTPSEYVENLKNKSL
ncbi:two-component regulator propeller domain-containing protein [Chitinophaga sancti]|uniref:hybrid sensor histidine kinase/response regulator transcription factor n=1 Tax=Chitinophaga sancti TaxID=1004 RepID=UPI002A751B07|nr:two-component regulator propeller domain-containing protein [Chitinophaga sancti]WPQ61215.1 two-component regulator propeller domain-containing protein [Chitinophaga sancti]